MNTASIRIRRIQPGDEEEIIALYRSGDWWVDGFDETSLHGLISGSYAFLVAQDMDTGSVVGMGRLLSDGASDAYVHDLIVLPGYRDQGIGSAVLEGLIRICHENRISWIGLIAGPDTEFFYTRAGFRRMGGGYTPMLYEGS